MDQRKEQRVYITLCANLGKSATDTLTMIQQAFGYQMLSRTHVFQWHAQFKTVRTSVDDDEHSGSPTLVRQDRRRTIHDIAEEVGIGYRTCQGGIQIFRTGATIVARNTGRSDYLVL
jgi:hypothetical protein